VTNSAAMGGAAASTNLLRSSVAPANVSQRSANLHPSGMAPTAGVGVMAAVGNMMANSKHANDSMAHSLDGLPPTAVMQVPSASAELFGNNLSSS
jgi:hypothetical protein